MAAIFLEKNLSQILLEIFVLRFGQEKRNINANV